MRMCCSRLNLKWTTVIRLGEQVREAAVFQLRHDRMVQYQEGSFFFRVRDYSVVLCVLLREMRARTTVLPSSFPAALGQVLRHPTSRPMPSACSYGTTIAGKWNAT